MNKTRISLKTIFAGFVAGVVVAGAGGASVYAAQAPARHRQDVENYILGEKMATQSPMGRVVNVTYTRSAGANPVVLSTVVSARVCAPLELLSVGCGDDNLGELVTMTTSGVAKWDIGPDVPGRAIRIGDHLFLEDFKMKSGEEVNRQNLDWPKNTKF